MAGSRSPSTCRFLRSSLNRIEQEFAFSSTNRLSAGLEIALGVGERALQLGDAIYQKSHVPIRQAQRVINTAHRLTIHSPDSIRIRGTTI